MGDEKVKVVCEQTVNGVTKIAVVTTAAGDQGAYLISIVGVGNQFWPFLSIPPGRVIGAKFNDDPNIAPTCTADPVQNNVLIATTLAAGIDPLAVLEYKP